MAVPLLLRDVHVLQESQELGAKTKAVHVLLTLEVSTIDVVPNVSLPGPHLSILALRHALFVAFLYARVLPHPEFLLRLEALLASSIFASPQSSALL